MSPENSPDDFTAEETELLANLSEIAASITTEDRERTAPPPDIWAGISNELFAPVDSAETAAHNSDAAEANLIDLRTERSTREQVSAPPKADLSEPGSSRSPLLLVAAAIIGLLVIGGAAVAFISGDSNPVYAADISNADLPELYEGTASAEIDDARTLMIEFDSELPTDEPVELWLIRPDLSDMVSLGIVEPGDSSWTVPEGIDPADYSLVDLSIEPDDGDETHSGRSILRGELTLDA